MRMLIENARNNNKESKKGITLIALVVTIIVLLILAGISISVLSGDNGVLTRAADARNKTAVKNLKEQAQMAITSRQINNNTKTVNMPLKEQLKNEIKDADIEEIPIAGGENTYSDVYYVKNGTDYVTVWEDGDVQEGKVEIWDGKKVSCPEFKNENNVWNWYIYTPSQLKFLADFANNGDGENVPESLESLATDAGYNVEDIKMTAETTIKLMNNLDMGAREGEANEALTDEAEKELSKWIHNEGQFNWTPIGINNDNVLNKLGMFEGNNNTIKGLYVNREEIYNGIFGISNTIQNLTILNSFITGNNYTAGISGFLNYGKIVENCHNKNTTVILKYNFSRAGGIVGGSSGKVNNCTNTGSIYGKLDTQQVSILIGGIVGITSNEITSCINYGKFVSIGSHIGGITGYTSSKVESCINYGNISTTGNATGGIVGYIAGNKSISLCCNNGHIKGNYFISGIVGFITDSGSCKGGKIEKNYNCGVIEGIQNCRRNSRS